MLIRNIKTGIEYECGSEEWANIVRRQAHFRFKVLRDDGDIIKDIVEMPIEVEEIIIDNIYNKYKDVNKADLIVLAKERGLHVSKKMRKQGIINLIAKDEGK